MNSWLASVTSGLVSKPDLPMPSHMVQCSWCLRWLKSGDPDLPVSFGCCESCQDRIERAFIHDVEKLIEETARQRRVA